jgi:hypothetical protein
MLRQKFWNVLVAISAGLLLQLAPAHATETPEGELAFSIEVPPQLTAQEVNKTVVMASMGRDWTIKEDAVGRVVIYLNHRNNEATVTYLISDKQIQAYCVGYRFYSKGTSNESKSPSQPKGWLGNLNRDITKGLQQAAYLKK